MRRLNSCKSQCCNGVHPTKVSPANIPFQAGNRRFCVFSSTQDEPEQVCIACPDLFYKLERIRTAALPFQTTDLCSACGLLKCVLEQTHFFCIARHLGPIHKKSVRKISLTDFFVEMCFRGKLRGNVYGTAGR